MHSKFKWSRHIWTLSLALGLSIGVFPSSTLAAEDHAPGKSSTRSTGETKERSADLDETEEALEEEAKKLAGMSTNTEEEAKNFLDLYHKYKNLRAPLLDKKNSLDPATASASLSESERELEKKYRDLQVKRSRNCPACVVTLYDTHDYDGPNKVLDPHAAKTGAALKELHEENNGDPNLKKLFIGPAWMAEQRKKNPGVADRVLISDAIKKASENSEVLYLNLYTHGSDISKLTPTDRMGYQHAGWIGADNKDGFMFSSPGEQNGGMPLADIIDDCNQSETLKRMNINIRACGAASAIADVKKFEGSSYLTYDSQADGLSNLGAEALVFAGATDLNGDGEISGEELTSGGAPFAFSYDNERKYNFGGSYKRHVAPDGTPLASEHVYLSPSKDGVGVNWNGEYHYRNDRGEVVSYLDGGVRGEPSTWKNSEGSVNGKNNARDVQVHARIRKMAHEAGIEADYAHPIMRSPSSSEKVEGWVSEDLMKHLYENSGVQNEKTFEEFKNIFLEYREAVYAHRRK